MSGGDAFVVWLEGPATIYASLKDAADGSYTATYNATTSGMYQLYITNGIFCYLLQLTSHAIWYTVCAATPVDVEH